MSKLIKKVELNDLLKDDQSLMIGGFLNCGTPKELISIIHAEDLKNLTLIANDTGILGDDMSSLIVEKRVKKVITSHIGTNAETGKQMNNQEIEVELVPQGTLVERIRAKGAGLGGVLTPTGVNTVVENGKKKMQLKDKEYLLEEALGADIALIKAWKSDTSGNLIFRYSARNFNPIMAMAADLVIVEAEEIVEKGELDANQVMTPGVFVDYILEKG